MHVFGLEMKAVGQILLVGLIAGAGLPVLFAFGIRASAWGTGGDAETTGGAVAAPHPLGKVVAGICFAIVIACVLLGLVFIVASGFGKALDFSHVFPTIVDK